MRNIETYEGFKNPFRNKNMTRDDIDLISDLFLEISDSLYDCSGSNVSGYIPDSPPEEDCFSLYTRSGGRSEWGTPRSPQVVFIDIKLYFSDRDNSERVTDFDVKNPLIDCNYREKKYNEMCEKLDKFIKRLKRYKFYAEKFDDDSLMFIRLAITK